MQVARILGGRPSRQTTWRMLVRALKHAIPGCVRDLWLNPTVIFCHQFVYHTAMVKWYPCDTLW